MALLCVPAVSVESPCRRAHRAIDSSWCAKEGEEAMNALRCVSAGACLVLCFTAAQAQDQITTDPATVPVHGATWGTIKALYAGRNPKAPLAP
jgi:hypothetical protein